MPPLLLRDITAACRTAEGRAEAMFFTRMLYSCLTDADYLDTEAFVDGHFRDTASPDMDTLLARFRASTSAWFPPKGDLNRRPCAILSHCMDEGASQQSGLFSLTVPTGGGKTATSLGFALAHAKSRGRQRVIYVIPYTSIIEQTAAEFRKLPGSDAVLEHHSGVLFDADENASAGSLRLAKASENWDMPVVVTTAVQFFASLFSNGSSKCRKLHNLAQSIIIFDEAQMLPLPYLRPCVWSIAQLVRHYRASAVLCTTTQPALGGMLQEFCPEYPVRELCPVELLAWKGFRRVTFRREAALSVPLLADRMNSAKQVLCIVNSKKAHRPYTSSLSGMARFTYPH